MHHIYSLLISRTTEQGASFFIFCLTLSVHVSTVSLLVRLFVSMCFSSFSIFIFLFFLFFLHKFLSVSVSMSLFVGLFACYSAPLIIFGNCLYSYCQFRCCGKTVIFTNRHPSFFVVVVVFSYFHPPIGGEFKAFSSSGIVYPYPFVAWVSRLR